MTFYIPLPNRGVILLQGPDTKDFLQGIISNDILKLQNEKAIYSLLLNPQGRYLYDFFLIKKGKYILLECENIYLTEIIERLNLFKTYLKVKIQDISKIYKVGVILKSNLEECIDVEKSDIIFNDPRHTSLGTRVIVKNFANMDIGNFAEYEQVRIQNLIPSGVQDMIQNKSFPLQFMADRINGIDFEKGCYTGQEVVARMHRTSLKRKIYLITSEYKLPSIGAKIIDNEQQEIGELRSSINNTGIALLNIEQTNKSMENKDTLFADGIEIKIHF